MRIAQQQRRDKHATTDLVSYDIETIVDDEPADGSFPPIPQHRPVAAAFLRATWRPGDTYEFELHVPICLPGEEPAFYREVNRCLAGAVGIGWNTRGFDNAVLRLQSWRCREFNLKALTRQCQAGRYDADHLDLADQTSGYGASRTLSLASVCEVLEIPVKVLGHGSHVGELWRAGDVEAVKRYVAEDVVASYVVGLHWFAWRDSDPSLMILPAADLAVWLERSDGLEHLRQFATCPPVLWARQQAPAVRAALAANNAERRLTLERDEAAFSA